MSWTVPVALFGFVPFVLIAFAAFDPRRAVLLTYLTGWMFLPVAGYELFGFDYTKSTAVPVVVFLAIALFDGRRLTSFAPRLLDLPMAAFCLAPMASSLSNELGVYDALSAAAYQTITWGLPYLTGRLYFSSAEGMRRLAAALLAGGLLYAPLCLWEIRMSPQLHATLYGFHQHDWLQTLRSGGYRPMVFMHHGLMVGMWMTSASIVGLALWASGSMRRLWGIPLSIAVPVLIGTTVLCKSFGALVLLVGGAVVLFAMRFLRTSLPMTLLLFVAPTYVVSRAWGEWAGTEMVEVVSEVSSERASSLAFRLEAEERLRSKAAEQPVFGWGGWGRSFVRRYDDPSSTEPVTVDSLWIIVFGKYGSVGLAGLLLGFLVPVLVLWRRSPPRQWARSWAAFPWALATVFTLYGIDNLVNAMVNPVYMLIGGGLCGVAPVSVPSLLRARFAGATRASAAARLP